MKITSPSPFGTAGRMLAVGTAAAFALLAPLGSALQAAPPVINVFTSITPSSASPNASAYDQNALDQISNRGGGTPASAGTGPSRYAVSNGYTASQIIFSQGHYNSWLGSANPGTTYGPAYANEFGNLLRFGLDAVGDGSQQFTLSQLQVTTFIDGSAVDSFTGADFTPGTFRLFTLVGGNYVAIAGDANTPVDRIVYRGAGLGFQALDPTSGQTNQDALNETIQGINDYNGPGQLPALTVSYVIVPEPGSIALSVAGGLALLAVLRRKQSRKS